MDRLKVDADELAQLHARLVRITRSLDQDEFLTQGASQHVGHDVLASRVREFATSWNDNRDKVVQRMTYIRDSVGKIGETFETVEGKLTGALDGAK